MSFVAGVAPKAVTAGGCEKSTARRCEIRAPRSCPPMMILLGDEDDLVEKPSLRASSSAFPTERLELAGIGSEDAMGVEIPYPGSSGTKRLILSFSAGTSCVDNVSRLQFVVMSGPQSSPMVEGIRLPHLRADVIVYRTGILHNDIWMTLSK